MGNNKREDEEDSNLKRGRNGRGEREGGEGMQKRESSVRVIDGRNENREKQRPRVRVGKMKVRIKEKRRSKRDLKKKKRIRRKCKMAAREISSVFKPPINLIDKRVKA